MVAAIQNHPRYRGSRGHGEFRLPSGQLAVITADDAQVIAELTRRGDWAKIERRAVIGQSLAFLDKTHDGVDIFLWFGHAEDGGFVWYAFPGAAKDSPDVRDFWAYVASSLFGSPVPDAAGGFCCGLS